MINKLVFKRDKYTNHRLQGEMSIMNSYVLQRIQAIEEELATLKKIISEPSQANCKETSIKGLWKDVTLNEDDFLEAERAIFRDGIDKKW
jgi:hypothetical protein